MAYIRSLSIRIYSIYPMALLVYLQKTSFQPNPHMSARNELEAGEEFHTLPGGVGDHTLYNAGMCTHTHAYAHNYPKNSRITIIPQNYKENIGA